MRMSDWSSDVCYSDLLGGKVADRFGPRDKKHILTLPAYGMALAAPVLFLGNYMDNWMIAVALLIVPTILNSAYYGPAYACVQGLVRPQARAVAALIMSSEKRRVGKECVSTWRSRGLQYR